MIALRAQQAQMEMMRDRLNAQDRRIAELERGLTASATAIPLTSGKPEERVPLPPTGPGILASLRVRGHAITIAVSSTGGGSPESLFAESDSEWFSNSAANSWIQWHLAAGIAVILESVKIRGRTRATDPYGVMNWCLEGSLDGHTWLTIMRSDSCHPTFQDWTSEAHIDVKTHVPVSYIRLTQTGPSKHGGGDPNHHLVLTYVDFGGTIFFS
jgi:hypothetical protein